MFHSSINSIFSRFPKKDAFLEEEKKRRARETCRQLSARKPCRLAHTHTHCQHTRLSLKRDYKLAVKVLFRCAPTCSSCATSRPSRTAFVWKTPTECSLLTQREAFESALPPESLEYLSLGLVFLLLRERNGGAPRLIRRRWRCRA